MSCNALDSSRADEPVAARARGETRPANVHWHATSVSNEARATLFRYAPLTFWLTGLSGAGKSTIAYELEQRLIGERQPCAVLDGDNLRHGLNRDLGFSERDRRENMRRAAEAARLMNDAGLIVVASLVSPFREDRAAVKDIIGEARFVEVYVNTPLTVCESRDPKGLYLKARRGDIEGFTGVSSPYEPPLAPALTVDTASMPRGGAAAHLYAYLTERSQGRDHDGGR
ncbi:adenylyl-sulfate kinase [Trinickia caryophylli]|uniref:Adenylyl-sulfate kinase n=2 Tax=Trinickia caryophylli TaxID=28094 RepID=A0A1X7HA58_TRICW|nr:adenylyl-sulfate kinase [Trinickia caryophylli]PMS08726.1 adenylyl-sulfate kinase [Trinickia caryophylli]TRX19005.1 adenylyl-sulfate kinase [Trinickia caryophylli]WQE10197.1 adenylyl-sulfate kinase [Trinickia caryophylli]SMF82628.1 adenylylsulfate kinase [Trinickia caryophylli]GLU35841.1 adenylyl-sulfate kinase [Trinickia caryophylli]